MLHFLANTDAPKHEAQPVRYKPPPCAVPLDVYQDMCEAGSLQKAGSTWSRQPSPLPPATLRLFFCPGLQGSNGDSGGLPGGPLLRALPAGMGPGKSSLWSLIPQRFPGNSRKLFLKSTSLSSNLGDKLIPIFTPVGHPAQSSAAVSPPPAQRLLERLGQSPARGEDVVLLE